MLNLYGLIGKKTLGKDPDFIFMVWKDGRAVAAETDRFRRPHSFFCPQISVPSKVKDMFSGKQAILVVNEAFFFRSARHAGEKL